MYSALLPWSTLKAPLPPTAQAAGSPYPAISETRPFTRQTPCHDFRIRPQDSRPWRDTSLIGLDPEARRRAQRHAEPGGSLAPPTPPPDRSGSDSGRVRSPPCVTWAGSALSQAGSGLLSPSPTLCESEQRGDPALLCAPGWPTFAGRGRVSLAGRGWRLWASPSALLPGVGLLQPLGARRGSQLAAGLVPSFLRGDCPPSEERGPAQP